MAVCRYHPDRTAIGVCMRCRAVICAACCTRVDGVNHCHACLKILARRDETPRSTDVPMTLVAATVLGLACMFFFGIAWFLQGTLAP